MKKILCIALVLVMVLGCFTACGNGDSKETDNPGTAETDTPDTPETDEPTANGDTIKIGGTGPLTGGAAIYGKAAQNGAQIAVDEINALGGLQFELKYEDDAHDPEKAINAYNALKDWGMQISLGSVTSGPGIATSVENNADRIFALTPSASSPLVIDGKDNVYQMCFSDTNQGTASAQYIFDQKLGTKIAVIYKNDDDYSKGIYETFMEKASELGLEVVSETTFNTATENDFTVQVNDAKTNGADLVFLPMYYTPASLIFNQAKSIGYEPKFFGVDGMDGILTMEGFDTAMAEGVMLLTPFNADATDEKTVGFVTKYQELHNEIPNQFAADGYDCIYAIYEACKAANVTADMTAAEINDLMIAQFTSMTFNGLTGENMTWDASGAVDKAPKGMVILNGAYAGM